MTASPIHWRGQPPAKREDREVIGRSGRAAESVNARERFSPAFEPYTVPQYGH